MVDAFQLNQETKDNLGKPDETKRQVFVFGGPIQEVLNIEEGPSILKTRNVSNDSIWGAFNWGESNWDSSYSSGFFLGNSIFGVLGTSELGSTPKTFSVVRVVNPFNRFIERFGYTTFKDTSGTTATWSGDEELVFATSTNQVAISNSIFLNEETIFKATFTVEGTNTSDGDYYLSADGGVNWEVVTLNTQHTFTNTGQDLRFKIGNGEDLSVASFPTEFGTWGFIESPKYIVLTDIKITYEV